MQEIRLIPQKVNLDLTESLMQPDMARFLKNVSFDLSGGNVDTTKGSQGGVNKPIPANEKYIADLSLPEGFNHEIGVFSSKQTKEVFVFVYNDKGSHTIYRLNGINQTYDIVKIDPLLNFQLNPEHFIHFGGCCLEVQYFKDPLTGKDIKRSFLIFTDGFNPQRRICVEDSVATKGFNPVLFPYFSGTYNKSLFINMGVPTPKDCIGISEVAPDATTVQSNRLLFNTWQFRLLYISVWGEPSEHGIISDMYFPGGGNCNPSSANLSRCLDLTFDAPPPTINQIQVEYRNCNELVWKKAETLDLYLGSTIGEWWLRARNPEVNFNAQTNKITYQFCADKECEVLPTDETNRLHNQLPRTSQAVSLVYKYVAFSNNMDGFQPFSKELRNKFKIVVDAPTDANPANSEVRNISILVEIWNPSHGSQPIYQGVSQEGGTQKVYGFGAYKTDFYEKLFGISKQYFINENQKGLVGYLLGTNAYTISKQYLLNESTGSFTEISNYTDLKQATMGSKLRYFQKFDFTNIPKGKYIFRLSDPQVDPLINKNFQKTSTTVWGQFSYIWKSGNYPSGISKRISDSHELEVDVCDKNYDSRGDNKILTIYDTAAYLSPFGTNPPHRVIEKGYVLNTDEVDELKVGVELLRVKPVGNITGLPNFSEYTDHNGFYWIVSNTAGSAQFQRLQTSFEIFGACGCKIGQQFSSTPGYLAPLVEQDFYMNKSNCKDYANQPCNIIEIRGKVKGCGSDYGIPNVGVVLTRGGSTRTDENGEFVLIAHDDIISGTRKDKIFFITNSCGFTSCNDGCIEPYEITIQPCITCAERVVNVPDTFVKFFEVVSGLLSGGVYPIGVAKGDWLGRRGFVQPLGTIKIPSFHDTHVFAPSTVRVVIDPSARFDADTEYLTFWIGAETSIEDYITWIVDDFQFVDNTGMPNEVSPTQIKIYYSSLVEFNKQNNYHTTTDWGFIDSESNTPVLSDQVEFLFNGDGEFFTKPITALVKYDKGGQYILINYTNDLKNLKSNALIRFIRPKKCVDTEPYFELCSTVNIVNGLPEKTEIVLNAYDTYYQKREIPVPVLQTAGDPDATPPTADIFTNELRIFGTPFESKSVSDYWGRNCWNVGRINSKNDYETENYHRNQVALSGRLSDNGLLNYLSYFDNAKKTSFDENSLNGIVSLVAKPGIILIIGQSNSVTVGFNDTLIRVTNNGGVAAGSIEDKFGKPTPNPGANYGCFLIYKNTIYEKNGLVHFVDSTKACVVQHNFSLGAPISLEGANSHIIAKIKSVDQYNNGHADKRYMTGVVNSIANEYILTDFVIKADNFINALREPNVDVQETLRFNILNKTFLGWYSYTYEGYAELEGEINDQQLFSFKNGIPYSHYNTKVKKLYNVFHGVECESVIESVIVIDAFVKKRPLAIGQYCKQSLYFADRVVTETGQESRILNEYWRQANFGYFAPFLCDVNTLDDPNFVLETGENSLLDGQQLSGTWIKVRLVNRSLNYSEFQGVSVAVFGDGNTQL